MKNTKIHLGSWVFLIHKWIKVLSLVLMSNYILLGEKDIQTPLVLENHWKYLFVRSVWMVSVYMCFCGELLSLIFVFQSHFFIFCQSLQKKSTTKKEELKRHYLFSKWLKNFFFRKLVDFLNYFSKILKEQRQTEKFRLFPFLCFQESLLLSLTVKLD